MKRFNEFINEGLLDKMVGPSKDDIKNTLDKKQFMSFEILEDLQKFIQSKNDFNYKFTKDSLFGNTKDVVLYYLDPSFHDFEIFCIYNEDNEFEKYGVVNNKSRPSSYIKTFNNKQDVYEYLVKCIEKEIDNNISYLQNQILIKKNDIKSSKEKIEELEEQISSDKEYIKEIKDDIKYQEEFKTKHNL